VLYCVVCVECVLGVFVFNLYNVVRYVISMVHLFVVG
jgi:hypothetical protein